MNMVDDFNREKLYLASKLIMPNYRDYKMPQRGEDAARG